MKKHRRQQYRKKSYEAHGAHRMKKFWLDERTMVICPGISGIRIEWISYDIQREILGIRMKGEQEMRLYQYVPEMVWDHFRISACPDLYYHRCISGHYPEYGIPGKPPRAICGLLHG